LDNIHALVHSFTNSSQARREGLKFQDIVYECVRADRFSVYAKHVSVTEKCDVSIDVEPSYRSVKILVLETFSKYYLLINRKASILLVNKTTTNNFIRPCLLQYVIVGCCSCTSFILWTIAVT